MNTCTNDITVQITDVECHYLGPNTHTTFKTRDATSLKPQVLRSRDNENITICKECYRLVNKIFDIKTYNFFKSVKKCLIKF